MEAFMQCPVSIARYRRVLGMLNTLNDYRRIAEAASCNELEARIGNVLELFRKGAEDLAKGKRKPVKIDEFGRTYTIGRRKTSTARVWVIPAKQTTDSESIPEPQPSERSLEDILLGTNAPAAPSVTVAVAPTTVLINNLPLASYFPLVIDREKIIRPLRLAGVLGGYNVFALVRGGGMTGQSGAVALGIAKGLVVHEPQMEVVLRKAKLLRRDPRMVERKKTGLAKARKRYTWVKR